LAVKFWGFAPPGHKQRERLNLLKAMLDAGNGGGGGEPPVEPPQPPVEPPFTPTGIAAFRGGQQPTVGRQPVAPFATRGEQFEEGEVTPGPSLLERGTGAVRSFLDRPSPFETAGEFLQKPIEDVIPYKPALKKAEAGFQKGFAWRKANILEPLTAVAWSLKEGIDIREALRKGDLESLVPAYREAVPEWERDISEEFFDPLILLPAIGWPRLPVKLAGLGKENLKVLEGVRKALAGKYKAIPDLEMGGIRVPRAGVEPVPPAGVARAGEVAAIRREVVEIKPLLQNAHDKINRIRNVRGGPHELIAQEFEKLELKGLDTTAAWESLLKYKNLRTFSPEDFATTAQAKAAKQVLWDEFLGKVKAIRPKQAAPEAVGVGPAAVPDVVYHGSGTADIKQFLTSPEDLAGSTGASTARLGTFFTENPDIATVAAFGFSKFGAFSKSRNPTLYTARLNLRNPLNLDTLSPDVVAKLDTAFPGFAKVFNESEDKFSVVQFLAKQKPKGYNPGNFSSFAKAHGVTDDAVIQQMWKDRSSELFSKWQSFKQEGLRTRFTSAPETLKGMGYDGIVVRTMADSGELLGKQRQFIVFDTDNISIVKQKSITEDIVAPLGTEALPPAAAAIPPAQAVKPPVAAPAAITKAQPVTAPQQTTQRVRAVQQKAVEQPTSVAPAEAKVAHVETAAPDAGGQPPRKPPRVGAKPTQPAKEPSDILHEISEKAVGKERPDQTLLRLHEGAISDAQRVVNITVRTGGDKLKATGIGTTKQGQTVAREQDIPKLDELYNALHNPSKVASGEVKIPQGMDDIYKELRELTDWETVARLDFDPEMATVADYFYRGWKPPKDMFPTGVTQGRPLVRTPAFKKPRVDATYQEMRDLGFEPLSFNPYQQWAISRMQGVKYREQMELVEHLKGMGDDLIKPHEGGPIPAGWRVPEVGPAFEGKPFSTLDAQGNPQSMFTRRWITTDSVANMLENMHGKRPNLGRIGIGGKSFDPLAIIDWLTFVPKRAKLFGSFFQQMDFLNRSGAGAWSMMVDSLQAGKPLQAVKALALYPKSAGQILKSNFSPTTRLNLAKQLDSTEPLIQGRPGVNLNGISKAGLSTTDVTMFKGAAAGDEILQMAKDTGAIKKAFGAVKEAELAMRRGLFEGVYRAAIITDIQRNIAPVAARLYPRLNDAQLNGMIAKIANVKYSTIPASQSVIQNRVLRETLRRVFFSVNESEGLLRQAAGAIKGPQAAYWRRHWIGTYLFLVSTAEVIHYASTGEHLPAERFIPIAKDNWGPLPFSYNTRFAAPTIPIKGKEGAEVTLDLAGQMDTALRVLNPQNFVESRESVPLRAILNQKNGTNFFDLPIDKVGPGGVVSRTAQLARDLFAPIGIGGIATEAARQLIPGAEEAIPPEETRLGLMGLAVQATGVNLRAERTRDFIVRLGEKEGINEKRLAEGKEPWDGTWDGLTRPERRQLELLPEARSFFAAAGQTQGQIGREARQDRFDRHLGIDRWVDAGQMVNPDGSPMLDDNGNPRPFSKKQWRDAHYGIQREAMIESEAYQRWFGEFPKRKPKNENEKALFGYYDRLDEATGKMTPESFDSAKVDRFLEDYMSKLTPAQVKYIENEIGANDTPKARQFRLDKRVIEERYWDPDQALRDKLAKQTGINFEYWLNQVTIAENDGDTITAKRLATQYRLGPYVKRMQQNRKLIRMRDAEVDRLLVEWGYYKNPVSPVNRRQQIQRARELAVAGGR